MRFLIVIAVFNLSAFAQTEEYVFSEGLIPGLAQGPLPRLEEIQSLYLQADLEEKSRRAQLGWEGYVGGGYAENRARPLINFQPIWSPIRTAEIGVRKATSYGVATQLGVTTEQVTGSSPVFAVKNGTTTLMRLGVSVDLWKDIFGRATRAELEQLSLSREKADIEKAVSTRAFTLSLRRLYWALVANRLSADLTQGLLNQSISQEKAARQRSADFVADASEVARYGAQVASRRSSLVALAYEREALVKGLVLLVPALGGREVKAGVNDLDATIQEVLACTQLIGTRNATPFDFTRYDEMLDLLARQKARRLAAVERSGGPDVKLLADYQATGVDQGSSRAGSIGGSVRDIEESNRTGFSVGLKAVVPLDRTRGGLEETQRRLEEHRFEAQLRGLRAQVDATHQQLQHNVGLLVDIIRYQKENAGLLRRRLGVERQKFDQARISVEDLLNNQDALLTSELGVVSAQLQILNSLFDYLVVFTETPCTFNQKI